MDVGRATRIPHLCAVFFTVLGVGFVAAPPARFSNSSFQPALAVAPQQVWGAILLAAAVLIVASLVTGRRGLRAAAYLVAAWWCLSFATTFVYAVATTPNAAFTGAVVYSFLGALFLVLARTARR